MPTSSLDSNATPKTSEFKSLLAALKVNGRNLFVTPSLNRNVYLSGRNIPGNTVMTAGDINTYEVLKAKNLIITESAIAKIQENN